VLLQEVLGGVAVETLHGFDLRRGRRLTGRLTDAPQHRLRGIAGHEPRDDEVQRHGGPDDDEVAADAAEEIRSAATATTTAHDVRCTADPAVRAQWLLKGHFPAAGRCRLGHREDLMVVIHSRLIIGAPLHRETAAWVPLPPAASLRTRHRGPPTWCARGHI